MSQRMVSRFAAKLPRKSRGTARGCNPMYTAEPYARHFLQVSAAALCPHTALGDVPPSEFTNKGEASRGLVGSARPGIFTPYLDLKWGDLQNAGQFRLMWNIPQP